MHLYGTDTSVWFGADSHLHIIDHHVSRLGPGLLKPGPLSFSLSFSFVYEKQKAKTSRLLHVHWHYTSQNEDRKKWDVNHFVYANFIWMVNEKKKEVKLHEHIPPPSPAQAPGHGLYNRRAQARGISVVRASDSEASEEITGEFLPYLKNIDRGRSGDYWHFCWYVKTFILSLKEQRFLSLF